MSRPRKPKHSWSHEQRAMEKMNPSWCHSWRRELKKIEQRHLSEKPVAVRIAGLNDLPETLHPIAKNIESTNLPSAVAGGYNGLFGISGWDK
jgi:hypothetical protein